MKYTPCESEIKFGNVLCPVSLQKIPAIEKMKNLRINVFVYINDKVYPSYISPREDNERLQNATLMFN